MPNLTKEEKDEIIKRHKSLVDEFNKYLPDNQKLSYDKDLEKRLDDEKEVEYYQILQTIKNRIDRQNEIYQEMIKKYGDMPQEKLLLARSFVFEFNTEDKEEAKKFNEELYQEYKNNPDKVFYRRYKEVLEFNPEKVLDIIDDKKKMAEFYLKHQTLCEDAFVFSSAMANSYANINPSLKKSANAMAALVEGMSYPAYVTKENMNDYFSFPKMTAEQALTIIEGNHQYADIKNPLKGKFNSVITPITSDNIREPFDTVLTHGYKLGDDFFYRYVSEKYDPKIKVVKEISLSDGIKQLKTNPNICVRERHETEIFNLRRINSAYDKEYMKIWRKNFSKNYDNKPFNYEEIKNSNRGGLFERLFKTSSREYLIFIDTFRDFNNPNSSNFMNKELLKQTAQAYFNYKIEQGISFSKMDSTGRNRLLLAASVIKTIDDMDENIEEVNDEIDDILCDNIIIREQFLKREEVDDPLNTAFRDDDSLEVSQLSNDKSMSI